MILNKRVGKAIFTLLFCLSVPFYFCQTITVAQVVGGQTNGNFKEQIKAPPSSMNIQGDPVRTGWPLIKDSGLTIKARMVDLNNNAVIYRHSITSNHKGLAVKFAPASSGGYLCSPVSRINTGTITFRSNLIANLRVKYQTAAYNSLFPTEKSGAHKAWFTVDRRCIPFTYIQNDGAQKRDPSTKKELSKFQLADRCTQKLSKLYQEMVSAHNSFVKDFPKSTNYKKNLSGIQNVIRTFKSPKEFIADPAPGEVSVHQIKGTCYTTQEVKDIEMALFSNVSSEVRELNEYLKLIPSSADSEYSKKWYGQIDKRYTGGN